MSEQSKKNIIINRCTMILLLGLLALIFLLILSGCGQKGYNYSFSTINKVNAILEINKVAFSQNYQVSDNFLSVPPRNWINDIFIPKYKNFKSEISAFGNIREQECDDYTRGAAFLGQLIQKNLAIGEFWFFNKSGQLHALNFIFVNDNGLKLIFFEPQEDKIVNLTDEEKRSCIAWKI